MIGLDARRSIPLVLAMAMAAACGGEVGPEADEAGTWTAREIARLGSLDDPHTAFADVADVLRTGEGLLVLEWGQPRIAVFDAELAWVEDWGGPGDGPGELRSPNQLGRTGDELWVRDPRGARLETYSPEGEPRESFRFTLASDSLGGTLSVHAVLQDGTLLAGPSARPIGARLRGSIRYADYTKVGRDGEVVRRLYRAEYAPGDAFAADVGGGRQVIGLHPIQHSPLVEPFPDGSGLVVVERLIAEEAGTSSFRLLVLDEGGGTVADESIPYEPVSAAGWRERAIQRLVGSAGGGDVPESMVQGLREDLPGRAFYPPVAELVAGADGTVWLRREPVDSTRARWEAYDRTGARLGRVDLPPELQLRHASRRELWGIETDELDVPRVVGLEVLP